MKAWTRVDHGDGIHKRLETMRKEKALGTMTAADPIYRLWGGTEPKKEPRRRPLEGRLFRRYSGKAL